MGNSGIVGCCGSADSRKDSMYADEIRLSQREAIVQRDTTLPLPQFQQLSATLLVSEESKVAASSSYRAPLSRKLKTGNPEDNINTCSNVDLDESKLCDTIRQLQSLLNETREEKAREQQQASQMQARQEMLIEANQKEMWEIKSQMAQLQTSVVHEIKQALDQDRSARNARLSQLSEEVKEDLRSSRESIAQHLDQSLTSRSLPQSSIEVAPPRIQNIPVGPLDDGSQPGRQIVVVNPESTVASFSLGSARSLGLLDSPVSQSFSQRSRQDQQNNPPLSAMETMLINQGIYATCSHYGPRVTNAGMPDRRFTNGHALYDAITTLRNRGHNIQ